MSIYKRWMLFDIGKRNEWTIANVLNSPFFCFQRRELGLGGQPRIKDAHSAAKNLKTPWDSSGPPFFHIWLQHSTAFKIMIPRNKTQKNMICSHHQPDKQWRFLASQKTVVSIIPSMTIHGHLWGPPLSLFEIGQHLCAGVETPTQPGEVVCGQLQTWGHQFTYHSQHGFFG